MEVSYRREAGENYMVIESIGECPEGVGRMLQENTIEGLLPVYITGMDGVTQYRYHLGNAHSLTRHFESRDMSLADMRQIISGLDAVRKKLADYLLDDDLIVAEPDMIFLSGDRKRVLFCCYPMHTEGFAAGVKALADLFIRKADHGDDRCMETACEIFEIACRESFTLDEIRLLLGGEPETETLPAVYAAEVEAAEPLPELVVRKESLKKKKELVLAGSVGVLLLLLIYLSGVLTGMVPLLKAAVYLLSAAASAFAVLAVCDKHRSRSGDYSAIMGGRET